MTELSYTTNCKGRCLTSDNMLVVQKQRNGHWADWFVTEHIDDDDIIDAIELMEMACGYC